ncbi:hypothetical protein FFLO_02671 [Filobasidium floriforme]|uniref:ZIP zinc/iron transport family n=1 Tax=Filobasidium floriforme TaxID=5210 RepID=A0A8K0JM51_9TREE|nr:hypothetical protein FFLO_02671 [Filobasidium floriforme]
MDQEECSETNGNGRLGLRIGGIFVVLVTSFVGTLAPILLKRRAWCPVAFFEFAKYFGSGVIIATAFIHLLAPAFDALGSPCLSGGWVKYDWAAAIAMAAVYLIFFIEFAAYRIGTARLAKYNLNYCESSHRAKRAHGVPSSTPAQLEGGNGSPGAGRVGSTAARKSELSDSDSESDITPEYDTTTTDGVAQLIAVAILEFGVILHSVFIGLTLAVNDEFVTLFIVIIFHQMFEGLGVGSRLSALRLPRNLRWAPFIASFLYSVTTPIGMAIGLGISNSYNTKSPTTTAWEGTLDAISAGILLYTGLVELLAHEILFNPKIQAASGARITYIFICILTGSGIMALIGYWV